MLQSVVGALRTVRCVWCVSKVPWRCSSSTLIALWSPTPVTPFAHWALIDFGGAAGVGIQVEGEGGRSMCLWSLERGGITDVLH